MSTPFTDSLRQQRPIGLPASHEISDVGFFPQKQYQCGPAALATLLDFVEVDVAPTDLVDKVYVPERRGSLQLEMIAATRNYQRLALRVRPDLTSLLSVVAADRPVLILQNLGLSWYPQWHYAVVVGYDLNKAEVILRSGETKDYHLAMATFERTWQRGDFWGFQLIRPGEQPIETDPREYLISAAALQKHLSSADAVATWKAAVASWPDNADIHFAYANVLYQVGAIEESILNFERVLVLQGNYAAAYNNLAQLYFESGDQEKAQQAIQSALELEPNNHLFRKTQEEVANTLIDK